MVKFNILAGGNFAFIASYLFNSVDKTLTLVRQNPTGPNPAWIERSVLNPSILYALNELEDGAIQSFTLYENGTLSDALSSTKTGGSTPAHVFSSPSGVVSAMNFFGGNGVIARMENNGADFGDSIFITFPPIGTSGVTHPHQTIQFGDELFVPDFGGDTVWRLTPNNDGFFSIAGQISQPTGSGPRHSVIHDDLLVTLHETANTITTQRIPLLGQNSSGIISSLSVIPEDQVGLEGAIFAAAELLIPKPNNAFPSTLAYASNRNNGESNDPRGDSIAVFTLSADGKLELVNQFFTGLVQVRGMQFGGPDNKFLVAGGVAGDGGVVVFERVGNGADFVQVASNTEVLAPRTFIWA